MSGLFLSLSQRLTQKLEQKLSLGQKLEVKASILGLRLDLTRAVHGQRYEPRAECPQCGKRLNPLEIIMGFRNDPLDYTTQCTRCRHRFQPKLAWRDDYGGGEIPFFCATQVLERLRGLETLNPEELEKEYPAVFHSVRVHHGNLRRAFEKLGIQYEYQTIHNWKEKVEDFLGKLPDTLIAEVVDMPVRAVRNLRRSLQIPAFHDRDILDIAEDLNIETAEST